MGQTSIRPTGSKFDPPGGLVPKISHPAGEATFSAVILHLRRSENLTRKEIGKTAGVGPETVKAWERGRQMGQFEHVSRLARSFRSVRRWTLRELGAEEESEFMTPRRLTAMMAAAYQVMQQENPDGDELRAAMAEEMAGMYRGLNGPGGAKK